MTTARRRLVEAAWRGASDRDLTGVVTAPDGALLISLAAKRMGSEDLVVRGAGAMDGFVVNLAADGDLKWIRRFGGHGDDSADQIALDAQGNAILAGSVEGTVFLHDSSLTDSRFWASRSADGRLDRVYPIESLPRLASNRQGEAVLAATFDAPIFLVTTLPKQGVSDAFLAWLGPHAEPRLARHLVGDGELRFLDLSVGGRGQAVIAGEIHWLAAPGREVEPHRGPFARGVPRGVRGLIQAAENLARQRQNIERSRLAIARFVMGHSRMAFAERQICSISAKAVRGMGGPSELCSTGGK